MSEQAQHERQQQFEGSRLPRAGRAGAAVIAGALLLTASGESAGFEPALDEVPATHLLGAETIEDDLPSEVGGVKINFGELETEASSEVGAESIFKPLSTDKQTWLAVNVESIPSFGHPKYLIELLNSAYSADNGEEEPVMTFSTTIDTDDRATNGAVNNILRTAAEIIIAAPEAVEELGFNEVVVAGIDGNQLEVVDGQLIIDVTSLNGGVTIALGEMFGFLEPGVTIEDGAYLDLTSLLREGLDYNPDFFDGIISKRFTRILPENLKTLYDEGYDSNEGLQEIIDSGGEERRVTTKDGYELRYVEATNELGEKEFYMPNVLNGNQGEGGIGAGYARYLLADMMGGVFLGEIPLETLKKLGFKGDTLWATAPFRGMAEYTSEDKNPDVGPIIVLNVPEVMEEAMSKLDIPEEKRGIIRGVLSPKDNPKPTRYS